MRHKKLTRKARILAALTLGTCFLPGAGCIQSVLSSIGVTFF